MAMDLNATVENKNKLTEEQLQQARKFKDSFPKNYQRWYSEATAVVKQLLPDRVAEFVSLYEGDKKRKNINGWTYTIQDWLNGIRASESAYGKSFEDGSAALMRFNTQIGILQAAQARFESSLFEIAQLARADLFDSELDAARELATNGFLRAAGAVTGVIIEKHLSQVCEKHNLTIRRQHPTINDFNEALKAGSVVDVPTWRQLQRLADLRNLCSHNKSREPARPEVDELIEGTDKLVKTVF